MNKFQTSLAKQSSRLGVFARGLLVLFGIWILNFGISTASAAVAAWPDEDFIVTISVINKQLAGAKNSANKAPAHAVLTGVRAIKTSNIISYHLTWSKGAATMACKDLRSGQIIEQHLNGSVFVSAGQSLTMPRLAGMDGAALDWLVPDALQGEEAYKEKGKKLLHYKRDVPVPPEGFVTYQAWIDPETKLPVALSDDVNLYEFVYSKEKPEPLPETKLENLPTLPAELKQEWTRRKKALEP